MNFILPVETNSVSPPRGSSTNLARLEKLKGINKMVYGPLWYYNRGKLFRDRKDYMFTYKS